MILLSIRWEGEWLGPPEEVKGRISGGRLSNLRLKLELAPPKAEANAVKLW